MSYTYEDPLDRGYKQFKLTKKQHNELFKCRQIKWCNKYEYYYNEHIILLYKFCNWKLIILNTILFPVNLIFAGLANVKELLIEYKKMYNQKKYGDFVSDSVHKGTETYDKIMEIIKNEPYCQ